MLKGYAQLICLYLLQLLHSSAAGDLFIVKVKCVGEEVSCGLGFQFQISSKWPEDRESVYW